MSEQPAVTPPSAKRGIVVVAVLALIFFALLALIVKFSRKATPPPPPPAEEMVVIPARLRIRAQPSAKASVVTLATRGQRLQLLEDAGAWVRVSTANNLTGWAERSALEKAAEQARRIERTAAIRKMPPLEGVATEAATLFSGPGIFYPPVGELKAGARVEVYTRDHDFYVVEAGDGVAYAEIDTIDVSAGGAQVEVASARPLEEETPEPDLSAEQTPEPDGEEVLLPPDTEPRLGRNEVYPAVPTGGTPPRVIDQVAPRYPVIARRARVEGRVVLRAVIRRDGSVGSVEVIRDLSYGLGEAAREAVKQWRFRPAEYRGEPIAVYYTVTVNFRLTR